MPPRCAKCATLGVPPLSFTDAARPLGVHTISGFKPLLTRVDGAAVEAMVESAAQPEAGAPAVLAEPVAEQIDIDAFARVDLRVARIVEAQHVKGADKLLQITVDAGEANPRTVFAGIKSAYAPEDLTGRLAVLVANLAPSPAASSRRRAIGTLFRPLPAAPTDGISWALSQ